MLALLLACTLAVPSEPAPPVQAAPSGLALDGPSGLELLEIAGPAHRVIIALHGLGDRPEDFASLARPWAGLATLLIPAGPDPWGKDGHSWFPIRAIEDSPALAEGVRRSADRVATLILGRTQPEDEVVVTGFSQGGMLSFALAVLHPEAVDLAIPLGGMLPSSLLPTHIPAGAAPIRALHGAADSRVPTAAAEDSVAKLAALGWDATIKTYAGLGHAINAEEHAELDRLVVEAIQP